MWTACANTPFRRSRNGFGRITRTVRDFALEIAYKKFTGDFGLDFLAHLRNQVGARQGSDF